MSFALSYTAERPDRLYVQFPTDSAVLPALPEVLELRSGALAHYVTVESYGVLVEFEQAFVAPRLRARATCVAQPLPDGRGTHRLYAGRRQLLMDARSADALERELGVIKEALLCGAFEDDEAGRHCLAITARVFVAYAVDVARLIALCGLRRWEDGAADEYGAVCHVSDLIGLARLSRARAAEIVVAHSTDEFWDLSTRDDADEEAAALEVQVCLRAGPTPSSVQPLCLAVSVNSDRAMFLRVQCALLLICAQCRVEQ